MTESPQAPKNPRPIARPILVRKSVDNKPTGVEQQPNQSTPAQGSAAIPRPKVAPAQGVLRSRKIIEPHIQEDELDAELSEVAIRNAPPWLVSLLVHLVAIIGLGLFMLPIYPESSLMLEVIYAESRGEQLDDVVLQSPINQPIDIEDPVLSEDEIAVDDPIAAPPDITPIDISNTQSSEIEAASIGFALSGREKGRKKALLAAYGGTETTEDAVARGLEWLKRNQNRDGMWSLTGPYSQGAPTENRAAATAMALLAFQGHGSTHKSGPYQSIVARGWNALIKKQDGEGNFFFTGGHHHRLYTHAQATIALCELYAMTNDQTLKAPAEKALSYCFAAQSPQGGWRYSPGGSSDTSVTGWFVMALQSGRMAGLTVPVVNLERISAYLDTATTDAGIRYAYMPGQSDTLSMTAVGLLGREYLGWKQSDPRLVQGLDYLGRNPINFAQMDVYYWYHCTQAMHHMGGEHWQQWNSVMRQSIPEEQLKTGNERGSWAPSRDLHGHLGGRLYTTCLCVYMLEVYYRHLPLYKHRLY